MPLSRIRTFASLLITFVIGAAFSSIVAIAWTGPTGRAPDNNVAAPINVGSTDQIKSGGLGVNSLAVFGNAILSGPSITYLNFGNTSGSDGYGIRDNNGTLEFKSTGGSWNNLANTVTNVLGIGAVTQIKFADGTTQTSAAVSGFTHMQTFVSSGTFVVPAGVSIVKATIVGGGGGSGAACNGYYTGGGGAGAAAIIIENVTPVESISYTVGNAGVKGSCSVGTGEGGNGGTTYFDGYYAQGGFGSETVNSPFVSGNNSYPGGGLGGGAGGNSFSTVGGSGSPATSYPANGAASIFGNGFGSPGAGAIGNGHYGTAGVVIIEY